MNSSKSVRLQRAGKEDWRKVSEIEKRTVGKEFLGVTAKKDVLEYLKGSHVYLLRCGNETVGLLSYKLKEEGLVRFNGVIVLPKYRDRGIAMEAMKIILSRLKGRKVFELVVHPKNTPALLLYLELGFRIMAWVDNYGETGEPRLRLRLKRR